MKPTLPRVCSITARISAGQSAKSGAPKREGAATCAAPSLKAGLGLLGVRGGEVATGHVGFYVGRRFMDVDRVRAAHKLRQFQSLEARARCPIRDGSKRICGLRVERRAGALVDVGRLRAAAAG